MSRVVNVRKFELRKLGYNDLEHWLAASPDHVYIGRSMVHYVKGAVGSKWANPYKGDKQGREKRIQKYEEHLRNTPELIENIMELDGKIIGCWCHPEPCHGDVIVKSFYAYDFINLTLEAPGSFWAAFQH